MAETALKKQPAPGKSRGAGKPFEKGHSGNPRGKPRGARSKSTVFGETILLADADDIVRAVVAAAKAGDPTAMRLTFERLVPIRKGRPIKLTLPPIKTEADVDQAIATIIGSMAAGDLTPDEAGAVASVVELRRRSIELGEHAKRLAALEERANVDK